MKNKLRSFKAVVLGGVMALTMSVSAFAAETDHYADDKGLQEIFKVYEENKGNGMLLATPVSASVLYTEKPTETSNEVTITQFSVTADNKNLEIPATRIMQTKINDTPINLIEFDTIIDGENTLIPLRLIGETLGFEVVWNGDDKSIFLDDGMVKSTIKIGNDLYYKASSKAIGLTKPMPLGSAPVIVEGKTYVPISFFNLLYNNENALVIKDNVLEIAKADKKSFRINETRINDKPINLIPFEVYLDGENMFLPLEIVGTTLNFKVTENEDGKSYNLDNGITKSTVTIGEDNYFKASSQAIGMAKPSQFGSAPKIIDEKVYVPLQYFNLLCGEDTLVITGERLDITMEIED